MSVLSVVAINFEILSLTENSEECVHNHKRQNPFSREDTGELLCASNHGHRPKSPYCAGGVEKVRCLCQDPNHPAKIQGEAALSLMCKRVVQDSLGACLTFGWTRGQAAHLIHYGLGAHGVRERNLSSRWGQRRSIL